MSIFSLKLIKMAAKAFTASIHKEDEIYVATCIEIGTVSQGGTMEEALANLKEATEAYLEEFPYKDIQPTFLANFTTEVYA